MVFIWFTYLCHTDSVSGARDDRDHRLRCWKYRCRGEYAAAARPDVGDPSDEVEAYRIILPGNTSFETCMKNLTSTGLLPLIKRVAKEVGVLIMACGFAGTVEHLAEWVRSGASAVEAGSMIVFHGKHHAALINYSNLISVL